MSFFFNAAKSLSIFEKFDMFGVPITMRFNGSSNHKTLFGSIITLSILIILVYQIFETCSNLLNYVNYTIVYQENIVLQPTSYDLLPTKFTFAFGIQDTTLKTLLDEQVFYFEAVFADTRRQFNNTSNQYEFITTYIDFKPIPCTEKHFQVEGATEYFLKLPYKDLYCLPLNIDMTLQGQYGADIYKWLRFRLKKCTDPIKCKSKTEVEQKMGNCNFQVYYVNYVVEITDRKKPFKPIGQNTFWKPSSTLKNINMYFKNSFVESEEGIFQTVTKNHNALLYSFDRDQIVNVQSEIMFELYVQLEKNKESQYIRKYQKLSQAASQLGGLFNFLFALGAILCYPFSKIVLHQKLLNNIFKFEVKKQSKENQSKDNFKKDTYQSKKQGSLGTIQQNIQSPTKNAINSEIFLSQPVQNSPNIQNNNLSLKKSVFLQKKYTQQDEVKQIQISNSQIKNIMSSSPKIVESMQQSKIIQDDIQSMKGRFQRKSQQKEIEQQQQKYILSIFKVSLNEIKIKVKDILSSFFCSRQSQSKMINYGLEKLNYHLDIETIIIKLLEIEKLKQLVLNENQIKLFEFIPQPVIHEELFTSKNKQEFELAQKLNPLLKTGIFYEDRRNLFEKANDAQDAYNKIFKCSHAQTTNIDKKLLSLLDPRVSSRFDQNLFVKDKEYNVDMTFSNQLSQSQQNNFQKNDYENLSLATETQILFGHRQNTTCNKNEETLGN